MRGNKQPVFLKQSFPKTGHVSFIFKYCIGLL